MKSKQHILVIDDEPSITDLLSIRLKSHGYSTAVAHNGEEGLEKIAEKEPDLIILDINMPVMGGMEFYNRICDEQGEPKYHVLVLTARGEMEQLFKEFDIDGFMSKPFDGKFLLEEVDSIIHRSLEEAGLVIPESVSAERLKELARKRIIVADDKTEHCIALESVFADTDYSVETVDSGTAAIVKVADQPPSVFLIRLGMEDIAGDVVILRLSQMAKTEDVACILYVSRQEEDVDDTVLNVISHKSGVRVLHKYGDIAELKDIVEDVYKKTVIKEKEKEVRREKIRNDAQKTS